jgi:ribosomal protein S18 acetylase RimI-like enzyme
MPQIQIRSATALDIAAMIGLNHNYETDYVWQIDVQQPEEGEMLVAFREMRLPRPARAEYPRSPQTLQDDWQKRPGLLIATMMQGAAPAEVIGYVSLSKDVLPATAWITDLVVTPNLRRMGIGTALVLAAQEWASEQGCQRLILEMQPKNYPAICLAQKFSFSFCGYHDRYYANQDIALFFVKTVR